MKTHIKDTAKSAVLALCEGNSQVTSELPVQMDSNVEKGPTWWRLHGMWGLHWQKQVFKKKIILLQFIVGCNFSGSTERKPPMCCVDTFITAFFTHIKMTWINYTKTNKQILPDYQPVCRGSWAYCRLHLGSDCAIYDVTRSADITMFQIHQNYQCMGSRPQHIKSLTRFLWMTFPWPHRVNFQHFVCHMWLFTT